MDYNPCFNGTGDNDCNTENTTQLGETGPINIYNVPVGIIVLLSIFYGSISILAVFGNLLVIWIIASRKQMQTVTNLFISNLALADVIIGLFSIPFQFQAALLQKWYFPDFMCPFCPFIQVLSVNVSVFTLTAIAVDRHRAILNPLRARTSKHISKLIITVIWIVSAMIATPIAIIMEVIPVRDANDMVKPFCFPNNMKEEVYQIYRYCLIFFQYIITLGVISCVYIQMAITLWGSKTPGNAQDARDINLLKNKKKVIKMLVIVVIIFGICWLPLQMYNFLQVTFPVVNKYKYINIIFFCCDWLAMSNSCYNPFIYAIYNEKFKREFRRSFPFCRQNFGLNHSGSGTISMYTRASSIRSTYTSSQTRNKAHNLDYNSIPLSDVYLKNSNDIAKLNNSNAKITWTSNFNGQSNGIDNELTIFDLKNDANTNNCNHCKSKNVYNSRPSIINNNNNIKNSNIKSTQQQTSPLQLIEKNVYQPFDALQQPANIIIPSTSTTTKSITSASTSTTSSLSTNNKIPISTKCCCQNKVLKACNQNDWINLNGNFNKSNFVVASDDDGGGGGGVGYDDRLLNIKNNKDSPALSSSLQSKLKFCETKTEIYSLNGKINQRNGINEFIDDDGNGTSYEDIDV